MRVASALQVFLSFSAHPTNLWMKKSCGYRTLLARSCFPRDPRVLIQDQIIAKVLRISADDDFGLSKAFVNISSESEEISEIIASHSFLPAYDKEGLAVDQALRVCSRQRKGRPAVMWNELGKQLTSAAVSMDKSS